MRWFSQESWISSWKAGYRVKSPRPTWACTWPSDKLIVCAIPIRRGWFRRERPSFSGDPWLAGHITTIRNFADRNHRRDPLGPLLIADLTSGRNQLLTHADMGRCLLRCRLARRKPGDNNAVRITTTNRHLCISRTRAWAPRPFFSFFVFETLVEVTIQDADATGRDPFRLSTSSKSKLAESIKVGLPSTRFRMTPDILIS